MRQDAGFSPSGVGCLQADIVFGIGPVDADEVAERLRHSDIQITMRYAHLAPENVRAAAAVLDRFDGIESRFGHVTQHHLKEVV